MPDAPPRPVDPATTPRARVNRTLDRGAAYAWRLLAIGLATVAAIWLTGQLLVVVVPVAIAALLARGLMPINSFLRARRLRPALAAAVTLVGFLVVLVGVLAVTSIAVADEFDQLGPTVSAGVDDLEDWLVDDSPFDVSRSDVDRWRQEAADGISSFVGSSGSSVVSGAVIAVEAIVGLLLALIVTFFILKDGRRAVTAAVRTRPPESRELVERVGQRAWAAAGGYLRGAALLGVVESIAIGIALFAVGADLVAPVMLLTFLAAFVPIVGASAAGVVAVLIALVTAGTVPALIVAAVALTVQQLDNDLLAPVVYGRALQLHPLAVLLGIAAGGALFGFVGTFLAVPVLAVVVNSVDEVRSSREPAPADEDV